MGPWQALLLLKMLHSLHTTCSETLCRVISIWSRGSLQGHLEQSLSHLQNETREYCLALCCMLLAIHSAAGRGTILAHLPVVCPGPLQNSLLGD